MGVGACGWVYVSEDRKPKPCWLKRLDLATITAPADPTDPANLRNNGRPITASADPSALGGDEGEEGEAAKQKTQTWMKKATQWRWRSCSMQQPAAATRLPESERRNEIRIVEYLILY